MKSWLRLSYDVDEEVMERKAVMKNCGTRRKRDWMRGFCTRQYR